MKWLFIIGNGKQSAYLTAKYTDYWNVLKYPETARFCMQMENTYGIWEDNEYG